MMGRWELRGSRGKGFWNEIPLREVGGDDNQGLIREYFRVGGGWFAYSASVPGWSTPIC